MAKFLEIVALLVLGAVIIYSGWFAHKQITSSNAKEAYWLFGFCLLLFTLIYSVKVLGISIQGKEISIQMKQVQEARDTVLATQQEVDKIATELVKTLYLLMDGSGRFGGFPAIHRAEMAKHFRTLEASLTRSNPNLRKEIDKMMYEVKRQMPEGPDAPNNP